MIIIYTFKENQTQILKVEFGDIPELPKNIEITGLEVQLKGLTDIHSDSLILDDRSQMLLPTVYTKANGETFTQIDNIQINNEIQYWEKGKGVYKIGGKNDLFNLPMIKRSQIQNGLTFHLAFTNLNTFLKATIVLYSIQLIIYYKIIYDSYDIEVELDKQQIILDDPEKQNIVMKINLKNTGEIPVVNKNIYIAHAQGIDVTHTRFPTFDLDVGEEFTIGNQFDDQIIITPTEYQYLKLIQGSEISKGLDIYNNETIEFYYKMNNKATIDIYVNEEKIDSVQNNTSSWTKYVYRIKKCDRLENNQENNEECDNRARGWGNSVHLKIKIPEASNNVFIKNPSEWNIDASVEQINEIKTGLYDIIVFCDEKSIKNTITIRQTK